MRILYFCLFLSLLFLPLQVNAQTPTDTSLVDHSYSILSSGNYNLDKLIQTQASFAQTSGRSMSGYRIRIASFSGQTARQRSETVMNNFYQKFPSIPVYRIYVEPDYKVYVGDYRTKTDAYRDLQSIQAEYPTAFIVTDKIKLPAL